MYQEKLSKAFDPVPLALLQKNLVCKMLIIQIQNVLNIAVRLWYKFVIQFQSQTNEDPCTVKYYSCAHAPNCTFHI